MERSNGAFADPVKLWGQWYENTDRYGTTTSKHHSQAHPHRDTIGLSCDDMQYLEGFGAIALTRKRVS